MSQTFVRCPHCNLPHPGDADVCPVTGKAMPARRNPSTPPDRRSSAAMRAAIPVTKPPAPPLPQEFRTPSSPPPKSLIGKVVDKMYRISGILGRGGMATVYEGEELKTGRMVALKVLPGDKAQVREAKKRFFNEARATASLTHPNICPIYHFGTLPDGRPFYAMEKLVGEPLSDRLDREEKLPQIVAVEIMIQVLSALRIAHKAGIVHRDIKPDNIFLHQPDHSRPMAKVVDFGLSKDLNASISTEEITQLTRTGFVMGTPHYLAPEQATGDRDFDPRMDLWSTGVVLYESVSGKRPFEGPNFPALMQAILHKPPPRVSEKLPDAHPGFDVVIERALAKNKFQRYQKASEFLNDLMNLRRSLLRKP